MCHLTQAQNELELCQPTKLFKSIINAGKATEIVDCISNLNKTAVRKSCKMCINANYINTQATGCVSSTCASPAVTRVATATCGLEGDHLAEPGPCSQSLIKEHYIQPILFDRHP